VELEPEGQLTVLVALVSLGHNLHDKLHIKTGKNTIPNRTLNISKNSKITATP
jgi:hypothetical protein